MLVQCTMFSNFNVLGTDKSCYRYNDMVWNDLVGWLVVLGLMAL